LLSPAGILRVFRAVSRPHGRQLLFIIQGNKGAMCGMQGWDSLAGNANNLLRTVAGRASLLFLLSCMRKGFLSIKNHVLQASLRKKGFQEECARLFSLTLVRREY